MITIYSQEHCQACGLAKRLCTKLGIAYKEVDLSREPAMRDYWIKVGAQATPIIQLDDVNHTWFSGFRPDKIKALASTKEKTK